MRFLSRKDGKNTISANKSNEKVKQTRLLEFVQARKPEQAKIGEIVRFLYYEAGHPDGDAAAYWMQGKVKYRLDKYKRVEQLQVINCWGKMGVIPETVTVNLSKSTVWSLGTEVTVTTEEDEVIAFEEAESCVTSDEIDETKGESPTDDGMTPANC